MNYSNPLDAVPDVSLETRLIITEDQCVDEVLGGGDCSVFGEDMSPRGWW